jgi:hypothetical protein
MSKKKATKVPLKTFEIIYTTTGRASATVEAATLEEAEAMAKAHEAEGTLIEWEYDEVESVEEQT